MIPPLHQAMRITDAANIIGRDFHRWLQLIERSLNGASIGLFATGSFVVSTNEYAIQAEELILNGNDEVTVEGDGVLVVV